MVKKELFSYPILGKIMLIGSLVPVDRGNRDAGISAVREAVKAIEQGLNMTIYIEGKRSFDGRLLPFKKGPFYLAEECNVPIVPITISGTQEVMPKARFAIGALCDMVALTRKLTVVIPPWAPRYDRARDSEWRDKDGQYAALVTEAGRRCGFDVLNIQSVAGLEQGNYADEMHVNASGVPIYTRYIVSRLKR